MAVIGSLGALVLALIVLGVGGLTLWSGWQAFRDELGPGFRISPPGARSIGLTLLGVVLPVLMIALFTVYLALVLVRLAVGAL